MNWIIVQMNRFFNKQTEIIVILIKFKLKDLFKKKLTINNLVIENYIIKISQLEINLNRKQTKFYVLLIIY